MTRQDPPDSITSLPPHGASGPMSSAGAQVGGEANAPRRTVSELLASDDAIVEPAMNRRGCDTERGCRLFDGQQFTLRRVVRTFEAGDVPVSA